MTPHEVQTEGRLSPVECRWRAFFLHRPCTGCFERETARRGLRRWTRVHSVHTRISTGTGRLAHTGSPVLSTGPGDDAPCAARNRRTDSAPSAHPDARTRDDDELGAACAPETERGGRVGLP